jgi:NAD(P)-dependent dehydrogenase (short-subunit alcohol dehydrogenase family)
LEILDFITRNFIFTRRKKLNMNPIQGINELITLRGKRALITGAAAGIGRAIAHRFAEAGANLDLVDIDQRCLSNTKKELAVYGTPVRNHLTDFSDREQRQQLWETIDGKGPDILVNNAGIYPFKEFLEVDEGFYKRVIETNLDAVYWMCQQMIRIRKKIGGVIINVASIEALMPFKDDLSHYSISKAGVIALTRSLAKEHAKHGFRVNAILPEGIITQGTKAAAKGIFRLKLGLIKAGIEFKQRLPVGRLGQPDEVARIALVLASDLASYVHGTTIPIDGGFLAA